VHGVRVVHANSMGEGWCFLDYLFDWLWGLDAGEL
jgi:hypothetical protein